MLISLLLVDVTVVAFDRHLLIIIISIIILLAVAIENHLHLEAAAIGVMVGQAVETITIPMIMTTLGHLLHTIILEKAGTLHHQGSASQKPTWKMPKN